MPDPIFTQKRDVQFRGPSTSDDYNARIEENYNDLLYIRNLTSLTDQQVRDSFWQLLNHCVALSRTLDDIEARITSLEFDDGKLTFGSVDQEDTARFDDTIFEVPEVSRNTLDDRHGIITLPLVPENSVSKLAFVDTDGLSVLPPTLQTRVVQDLDSVDDASAVIDSTEPEWAIARSTGVVWERKVTAAAVDSSGAALTLYVRLPNDFSTTDKSNTLILHPYPLLGTDIIEVAYTNATDPIMDDSDGYYPLNRDELYDGESGAVGFVPPGAWDGDIDVNAGMRAYHFNPIIITGLRIKLRQRNYYTHGSSFIYSYGLTDLDLRYNKYLDTGKCIIRFDAPTGETISAVNSVTPQIFNEDVVTIEDAFSYRVIWETSYGSNSYTLTPVPLSQRVWIEVTLNKNNDGGTPALTGLAVDIE